MAAHAGYLLIEGAIPSELATEGASAIDGGLQVMRKLEKITEYVVPKIGEDIKQAFIKDENNMKLLTKLGSDSNSHTVQSIEMGVFNKSIADPKKPKSLNNNSWIIVTIALTELNPENGWFTLLEGSHERAEVSSLERINLRLKPGDAVAFRGSLAYLHSSGGGGMFETLKLV